MYKPFSLPLSHPTIRAIVQAGFGSAKSRRPVKIECRTSVHVADYWDGGSRDYCAFVQLSNMCGISSESIPKPSRQSVGNPYHLPIANVELQPGFVAVKHVIFRGKDLGYRIYVCPNDLMTYLPEAKELLPEPEELDSGAELTTPIAVAQLVE